MICPFCKRDPYHYVDIGIGLAPAAVDCCDLGIGLFSYDKAGAKLSRRVLRDMRSHSPRAKARAMKVLREYGYKPEKKGRGKP
ncbi:hypothetical protein [Pseudomonas guariconensis]|uniref:hypothetical protein n=1 Tax=Pseudomonas guariconensis TaxID=1288410 RepID=UPI002F400C23